MCARRRTHLLLRRQKKVGQEKATPSLCPCASLRATCDARSWGGAAELTAFPLRANSVQTAAASQIKKCVCPAAHAPTPGPALLGAASRGGERGQRRLLLRSRAGCRLRAARCRRAAQPPWRAERSEGPQAERSNGPCGARSHPLLTVPRSAGPGMSACRRTRASLSSLPQLFERSSKNAASSAAHPRTEHRRLPRSPPGEWGHGQRGRLSFGYFSLAKQKTSTSAAGPRPGLRPQQRHGDNKNLSAANLMPDGWPATQ